MTQPEALQEARRRWGETLRGRIRCFRSKGYADFWEAVTAMTIAKFYGHHSRVENCLFCNAWHMHDR